MYLHNFIDITQQEESGAQLGNRRSKMNPKDLITKNMTVSNIIKLGEGRGYHGLPGKPHRGLMGVHGGSMPRSAVSPGKLRAVGRAAMKHPKIAFSILGLLALGGSAALKALADESEIRELVSDVKPTDTPQTAAIKITDKAAVLSEPEEDFVTSTVSRAAKDILAIREQKKLKRAISAKDWEEYKGEIEGAIGTAQEEGAQQMHTSLEEERERHRKEFYRKYPSSEPTEEEIVESMEEGEYPEDVAEHMRRKFERVGGKVMNPRDVINKSVTVSSLKKKETKGLGLGIGRGRGAGPGRGTRAYAPEEGGRGRLGGNKAGAGPGSSCICPKCGARIKHAIGTPCYDVSCPKCHSKMQRA